MDRQILSGLKAFEGLHDWATVEDCVQLLNYDYLSVTFLQKFDFATMDLFTALAETTAIVTE